jgi:hypothetical protein
MIDVDEIYRIPIMSNNSNAILKIENIKLESHLNSNSESILNFYKLMEDNVYQRHCNQLLIRGDNIVIISMAD